jgi:hypothetical protein
MALFIASEAPVWGEIIELFHFFLAAICAPEKQALWVLYGC